MQRANRLLFHSECAGGPPLRGVRGAMGSVVREGFKAMSAGREVDRRPAGNGAMEFVTEAGKIQALRFGNDW